RDKRTFKPLRTSHISQPYRSKTKDEGIVIALSTPIRDPEDRTRVVGVLVVGVPLADLHRWLADVDIDNGFAVLLDRRGHCLHHREMERIKPQRDQDPPTWDCPTFRALVRERQEGRTTYQDPI